ncbi:MAG: hypothetical protein OXG88_08775 [Gammaproteobacteria bacterium]|nr:hypothetical protein [Gammaproteobacteria bacterium]MDE2739102.1 hypothetical protein [Paracoccaceae bacterium]
MAFLTKLEIFEQFVARYFDQGDDYPLKETNRDIAKRLIDSGFKTTDIEIVDTYGDEAILYRMEEVIYGV